MFWKQQGLGRRRQRNVTVSFAVEGRFFFAGILFLPVLANGIADFDQPSAVFRQFQHIRRGEILGGVLGKITERLEQSRRNQRRNIVRLAVQHPARLLRREAGGQLAEQRQEPGLFFFHATPVRICPEKRTVIYAGKRGNANGRPFLMKPYLNPNDN